MNRFPSNSHRLSKYPSVRHCQPRKPQRPSKQYRLLPLFLVVHHLGGEILLLDTTHLVAERTEIKLKMSCKISPYGLLFTVPKDALQTAEGEESPTV